MPIDTSIYSQIRQPQQDNWSPTDSLTKAMTLSDLALKNQAMQRDASGQQALRNSLAKNVGPDGKTNYEGAISDLAKSGYADQAMALQTHAAQVNKAAREDQDAAMASHLKRADEFGKAIEWMSGMPPEQRAQAWGPAMQHLGAQGILEPSQGVPQQYDDSFFNQTLSKYRQTAPYIEMQLKKAEIGAKNAETALVPLKVKSEQFGTRSPTEALGDQYNKDIAPIKSSQIAMRQMLDNYNNPSPQGDASLVLNAFKIKFPTAPDVNSLKELGESQATIDQWKNMFYKSAKGGLDQDTRDNLMRDGASTFRANYGSYQDTAKKYEGMANERGIPLGGLTKQPELDNTFNEAMALQKKIGPYVPPTERDGTVMDLARSVVSKFKGGQTDTAKGKPSLESTANADEGKKTAPQEPTIRIREPGPNGQIRTVPLSMKGAAIANGGTVVK